MDDNRDGAAAFLLTQLGTLAATRFAERVADLDLTPPHCGLLRAIGVEPGRSQQALSAQLGLLPSRLVALVDELEAAGLLERRRNPGDRRLHALHLTDAGSAALRDIGRVAGRHGHDFLAALDPAERSTLHDLLARLAEHHGLTPGVHPGYRTLGRSDQRPASSSTTGASTAP